jgi:hypothetical protein
MFRRTFMDFWILSVMFCIVSQTFQTPVQLFCTAGKCKLLNKRLLKYFSNGSTESAIFCCVSLLLERLKSERMIDVFNTVKTLQSQRPMLFTKLVSLDKEQLEYITQFQEHYAFCYDCVMEYLNSSAF